MFCSADKVWKYNFKEFSFAMGYKRVYMNLICRMWLVRGKFYHFPCTFPWPSLPKHHAYKTSLLASCSTKKYKHSSAVFTELGNSLYKYFTFSMGYIFFYGARELDGVKKNLYCMYFTFSKLYILYMVLLGLGPSLLRHNVDKSPMFQALICRADNTQTKNGRFMLILHVSCY